MTKHPARRRAQRGVALIEVLVTLVILLTGLLGLAGVAARANVTELESYQRVQALLLAQDMSDRLNANRKVATCYSAAASGVQVGTGYSGTPACGAGNAQQNAQAVADLTQWDTALKGSAEISGTSKVGAMIGAVGCVDLIDAVNNVYLISVSWQGMANTVAPVVVAGATPCGQGLYTDERMHRLVTTTVQIPVL